jgi:hypothetical protein
LNGAGDAGKRTLVALRRTAVRLCPRRLSEADEKPVPRLGYATRIRRGPAHASEIRASKIPVGRTPDERTLIAGLVLLHRCRALWEKDASVPASRQFMAAWCGLSPWRVRRAWKALAYRGVVIQVGEYLKRFERVRRSDGTVYSTERRGALWKLCSFIRHP